MVTFDRLTVTIVLLGEHGEPHTSESANINVFGGGGMSDVHRQYVWHMLLPHNVLYSSKIIYLEWHDGAGCQMSFLVVSPTSFGQVFSIAGSILYVV